MRTYLVICGTQRAVSRRRGLTMGESVWRYWLGVVFVALRLDLCRPLILESIYWNTTNTK